MPIKNRTSRSRQHGSSMVEAALVSVILFMLLFGIIGFSRAIWAYSWTSHASREASRWASVRGGVSNCTDGTCPANQAIITTHVKQNMLGLDPTSANVTVAFLPDNGQGNTVKVDVTYDVTEIVPFVPAMRVQSSSSMAISQ